MNILLIRAKQDKYSLNLSHFTQSEPLGLEMLYSQFEKEAYVEIFDMTIDRVPLHKKLKEKKFSLIGITSICDDIDTIISLSKKIKKINNKTKIFVGGLQATLTPKTFLIESIDYVFLRTTKENIKLLVNSVKKNCLIEIEGILTKDSAKLSTNIKANEKFPVSRNSTKKYRKHYSYFTYRPIGLTDSTGPYFEKDILQLQEKTIVFIDYDLLNSEEKITRIISTLKKIPKKNILAYSNSKSIIKHEKYLKELKKLGLNSLILFYHSPSQTDYTAAEILKSSSINLWVHMNLYPEYAKEDFKNINREMKKVEAKVLTLTPLFPLKGSRDYEYYKDLFLYKDISKHYGKVVIKPANITPSRYYGYIASTLALFYRDKFLFFCKCFGVPNTLRFLKNSLTFFLKMLLTIFLLKKKEL